MFYPLKFYPIYKEKIWGGSNLSAKIGRYIDRADIGESWDISCHPKGISVVANGSFKGTLLTAVIEKYPEEVLGKGLKHLNMFPLMVKLLDSNDTLSVQVHPDDEYACKHEKGEMGKNEMWYVLEAEPGAQLIYGLKPGTTGEVFMNAVKEGRIEDYLFHVPVKQGDVFNIKAGTVHALERGVIVLEIQQTSDATYRLYDWGRVDDSGNMRELHINKAMDVIDLNIIVDDENRKNLNEVSEGLFIQTKHYKAELLNVNGALIQDTKGYRFHILSAVSGEGHIMSNGSIEKIQRGDSVLIPAVSGRYSVEGNCKIIKTYC